MNEEYPQELFSCQNCDCIKEDSFLLECFHNICSDCYKNDRSITCISCADESIKVNDGIKHQLNELLHTTLNNPNHNDPDAMKCAACGKNEETVYCMDCKKCWCELGMEEHHSAIVGGDRHVTRKDFIKTGEGDVEDENNFSEKLERLQELYQDGNESQNQLQRSHAELDEKMREEEKKVDEKFEEIIQRLIRQKKLILEELNAECNKMHLKLDENLKHNEMSMFRVNRAHQLITKMREHKVTSEPMEELFTNRDVIGENRASIFGDINCDISWENFNHLPLQLFDEDTRSIEYPAEGYCHIKIHTPVNRKFTAIVQLGNEHNVITEDNIDVYLKITGSDNHYNLAYYDASKSGYPVDIIVKTPGEKRATLYYNGKTQRFLQCLHFTVKNSNTPIESLTARTSNMRDLGLFRAITATNDSLYCVVKAPPEIRKYYFKQPEEDGPISLEISFGEGHLSSPCGICYVDEEVYVVDAGFNCVHAFTNQGVYIEKFGSCGTKLGQFKRPMGIDFDYFSKEILVADTFNHRIQTCVVETKKYTVFGTNHNFKLKDPVDVKACRNGNTIVTTLGGEILLYRFREFSALVMNEILTPRHCCVDSDNNIYVTSHLGHKVYKISHTERDLADEFEHIALKTDSDFRFPTGIAINGKHNLYVISRELMIESSVSFLSIW